jgi:MFS family permease
MREVLRRPDFRILFGGMVATMVGESALLLVLAIWVKDLTGDSSLAGLSLLALVLPAVGAPLLGWVVDRFRRRPFLIAAGLSTVVVLSPLLLVRDRGDIWIIYAVGFAYGVSLLVVSAALNGLIKELLPEELLASANGALQTVRQGLRLVAPLGGAAVFTAVGGPAVVVIDMVCLLVGATAIMFLRVREARPERGELRWLGEVSAGIRHLFGTPALRRGALGLALAVTVLGFIETLVFAYVDLGLHRGPAFVSVIVCVQGVGGLTGGLIAARVVKALGEVGATALGVALFGVSFLGFVYPSLLLGFASAIVIGLGIPLALVGFNTLQQRVTPAHLMGRVAAASEALISTPQALSIALGAGLVTFIDYRLLFVVMAVVTFGATAYLWTGRRLSDPLLAGPVTVLAVPAPGQRVEPLLDVDDRRVGQG